MNKDVYVYFLNDVMYINLTNLCTNSCIFCIRDLNPEVEGVSLKITDEKVQSNDVIAQIKQKMHSKVQEVVFCGYGEPLIKLEQIKEVAQFLKENYPQIIRRINTNGQANVIFKRNIVPELVGLIDKISISLNSDNAKQYQQMSQSKFGEAIFEDVKQFIKECVDAGLDTTASVVTGYKGNVINVENCQKIADELGAKLRVREWLDEGYN